MGAGYHGGFGNTSGSKSGTSSDSGNKYVATRALRMHIENVDTSGNGECGIKGAHKKVNFLSAIDVIGAKIAYIKKNSQIYGVEKIFYKLPKKDKKGNRTTEFSSKLKSKTVYDSNIISTNQYIKQGLEAANNAAKNSASGKLGHEWNGTDNKGIKWHGYCDDSGNITSFFPED